MNNCLHKLLAVLQPEIIISWSQTVLFATFFQKSGILGVRRF